VRRRGRIALLLLLTAGLAFPAGPVRAAKSGEVRKESFDLLNQGVAAIQRGEYALAIEKLEKAASVSLNSFRANFYLGVAYLGDRRYSDAAEALRTAIDLEPNNLQAHVSLGDAYLKQGDTDEASAEYYRALKIRPEYAPALDGIARTYEAQGDDAQAVTFYQRAITSNKGYADTYTHLGDLYLRARRLDEAISLLVEAVTIRPDFGPGLNRLALAYSLIGLKSEAVATIRRAIALEPGSAEHRATLGLIQLDLGLLGGAEQAFHEAIKIDSGLPAARRGMADLERRRGNYDAALATLDALLADKRTDASIRTRAEKQRASLVEERDRYLRLQDAIAKGTLTPADRRDLAAIYAGRLQWDKAADLQAESAPEGIEKERLAYYSLRAGRNRPAYELYRSLAEQGSRADLEVNSGVALSRLGDSAGAAAAFRRALAIDPEQLRASLYLGNALLRTGKRDEAVAFYKKFLESESRSETAERVRRILAQIAPGAVPERPTPVTPPPTAPPPSPAEGAGR
jgi:tetratricopeptide (TPR) repeat protein